jgi:hypothetical protein
MRITQKQVRPVHAEHPGQPERSAGIRTAARFTSISAFTFVCIHLPPLPARGRRGLPPSPSLRLPPCPGHELVERALGQPEPSPCDRRRELSMLPHSVCGFPFRRVPPRANTPSASPPRRRAASMPSRWHSLVISRSN